MRSLAALAIGTILMAAAPVRSAEPADLVITRARIYTADPGHSMAEALAVRGGRLVYVGNAAGVQAWIGPGTRTEKLGGQLVLPGLIDAHMHPVDILDLDVCNLHSQAKTLAELSAVVAACLKRYRTPAGGWLMVHQWNYADGNEPDAKLPTVRAALDAASTRHFIQLLGNDGHHSAFNSPALAAAKNLAGKTVGMSRSTLATDFAAYHALIGVDAQGEPNGAVNEDARRFVTTRTLLYNTLDEVLKAPERIPQRLASVGITGLLDAAAAPEGDVVYDRLLAARTLTARVQLAQFYDPSYTRTASGSVDYDALLRSAQERRAKYAHSGLVHADFIKIFADGVMEGNPYAMPPTLPNSPSIKPYLQPIYGRDATGKLSVTGYVDTAAPLCVDVRAHPDQYGPPARVQAFIKEHGWHPGQCTISSGRLQHDRDVMLEYARRMHLAGFNLHVHAIGDRAVRTAVDAIEAARAADGNSKTRDGLAHVQLAHPDDVRRIGRDHLFVAFTYAWNYTDPGYDITVVPFLQVVHGNSYEALHPKDGYYELNAYPARGVRDAGGILVAGSDAPVDTADPRPFINMAAAVTRAAVAANPPLNPAQSVPLREVIDAYTRQGARMLGFDDVAGSLETGKSADFVVLDRDILALADAGHPEGVAQTQVVSTWFQGREVFRASGPAAAH